MLIACPTCATTYDVSAASLGPQGRNVRCVKCRAVWYAEPAPEPEPALAEAEMSAQEAEAPAIGAGDPANAEAGDERPGEDVALIDPGARALAMDRDETLDDHGQLASHESPPIAPDDAPSAPVTDIETLAARRARRQEQDRQRRLKPLLTLAILVLTGLVGGILGWRADVVRALPQTASLFRLIGLPVNLRGLEFSDLTSQHEVVEGVTVLVIEGKITNLTRQRLDVPRVRFALVNAAGGEVYVWTTMPSQPALAPDAVQTFRTRLASPPSEGRGIAVRFLNRRDGGGLK